VLALVLVLAALGEALRADGSAGPGERSRREAALREALRAPPLEALLARTEVGRITGVVRDDLGRPLAGITVTAEADLGGLGLALRPCLPESLPASGPARRALHAFLVRMAGPLARPSGVTDAHGRYALRALVDVDHEIATEVHGQPGVPAGSVRIPTGASAVTLDIVRGARSLVRVRVDCSEAAPLEGRHLAQLLVERSHEADGPAPWAPHERTRILAAPVFAADDTAIVREARAAPDGAWRDYDVLAAPGRLRLQASVEVRGADGSDLLVSDRRVVEVPAEGPAPTVALRIGDGTAIALHVVTAEEDDDDGLLSVQARRLPGAGVHAAEGGAPESERVSRTMTIGQARRRLIRIPAEPGTHRVRLLRADRTDGGDAPTEPPLEALVEVGAVGATPLTLVLPPRDPEGLLHVRLVDAQGRPREDAVVIDRSVVRAETPWRVVIRRPPASLARWRAGRERLLVDVCLSRPGEGTRSATIAVPPVAGRAVDVVVDEPGALRLFLDPAPEGGDPARLSACWAPAPAAERSTDFEITCSFDPAPEGRGGLVARNVMPAPVRVWIIDEAAGPDETPDPRGEPVGGSLPRRSGLPVAWTDLVPLPGPAETEVRLPVPRLHELRLRASRAGVVTLAMSDGAGGAYETERLDVVPGGACGWRGLAPGLYEVRFRPKDPAEGEAGLLRKVVRVPLAEPLDVPWREEGR